MLYDQMLALLKLNGYLSMLLNACTPRAQKARQEDYESQAKIGNKESEILS